MATIDKDLLLERIDRLLKLHNYAREDWFANTIHNTVWDAPEIEAEAVQEWIPCSERLPEEREWVGTKSFGTTKSDTILMTFDVDGTRFVKPLSLQNGKLSRVDAKTMDAFYKGWKMLAWMPLPNPYKGGGDE